MIFITANKHKYEEVKKIIPKIKMLEMDYPEIQADTLEEVAKYAIEFLKEKVKKNFFIEDSGLFIEALKGFPGVFSSYVFKTIGNEGILKLMDGMKNRKARFISIIAYYDEEIHTFKGECSGKISFEIRGNKGFGFDAIFIPNESKKTFGEMDIEEKNKYSHRGKAIKKFREYLKI